MAHRIIILNSPGSARRFFGAVARFCGGARKLTFLPVSLDGFVQTRDVAARALASNHAKSAAGRNASILPSFLQRGLLALQYNGVRRLMEKNPHAVALVWNGLSGRRLVFAEAAKHAGNKRLFAELSPLPGYLTIDPLGINYENSLPRQGNYYFDWAAKHPGDGMWRSIPQALLGRKPRRGRKPAAGQRKADLNANFLFLPLQVPSDTQVTHYGGWTASMEGLIDAVCAACRHLPSDWTLVIKEHPTSRIRFGERIGAIPDPRIVLDNETETFQLVARCRAVVTMNSSVGLQAFLFEKPVIVLGRAFFGWEPLSHVAADQAELDRLFAKVESLDIDAPLRAAFLRYLTETYYIEASLTEKPYLTENGLEKLKMRMDPSPN